MAGPLYLVFLIAGSQVDDLRFGVVDLESEEFGQLLYSMEDSL